MEGFGGESQGKVMSGGDKDGELQPVRQLNVLDGMKRWHQAGRDAGSIPHQQALVEGGIASRRQAWSPLGVKAGRVQGRAQRLSKPVFSPVSSLQIHT